MQSFTINTSRSLLCILLPVNRQKCCNIRPSSAMAPILSYFLSWGRAVGAVFHRTIADKHPTIRPHAPNTEHSSDISQNDDSGSTTIQAASPALTDADIREYQNYRKRQNQRRESSHRIRGASKIHRRPTRMHTRDTTVTTDIETVVTDYSDTVVDPALPSTKVEKHPKEQSDEPKGEGPRDSSSKSTHSQRT